MEIVRHKDLVDKPKGRFSSKGGIAGVKKHKHNTSIKPKPSAMENVKILRANGKIGWERRPIQKKNVSDAR